MDVVVCGHSLGGAIASIVAIKLFISLKRFSQKRTVKCITFGAPLIGDRDLQKNVPEEMLLCFHHFVSVNDPVLNLLRYTQSVLPWLQYISKRLPMISSNMQGPEDLSSEENTRNKVMKIKKSYSSVIEAIDKVMPLVGPSVRLASFFCPSVKKFQNLFNFIGDIITAIKDKRDVYTPIGNFHFLSENVNDNSFFSWDSLDELEEYIKKENRLNDEKVSLDAHILSHYTELFLKNGRLPFHEFPSAIEQQNPVTCKSTYGGRNIQFKYLFKPSIDSVELTKAQKGETNFLRLSFTGKYIHNIVLDLCQFDFDFPFAKVTQKVKIRKSLTAVDERLVIEQEMGNSNIVIPDCGIKLLLVTQFGECEKILHSKNVRDVVTESVRQIAENDSVSLVVKRAIQRGMALKKIQTKYGCNNSEQIIDEIIELGTVAIGEDEMKKKKVEIFTEDVKNIDKVFSNEKSFRNVKDFCNKIEEYIRSPLNIQAEWTAFQKIGVGFSAIAGGAIAASIVGPGLVSVGLTEVTSAGLVCLGGFAGAFTAGATATLLNNDQLTDSNYKNALNFIVQELLKAQNESLSDKLKAEIIDLIDEDNFFSNEKALIRLAPKKKLETEIFEKCIIGKSTRKSKEEVIKRIKAIQCIHRIRKIFSQQCFIGVVGLQDAGKTTLVKKIWNVGEKAGYFNHTKRPELHQITQKLQVIDFPGSDSLHYYSKTFSICGAMNNMIIAVIPFSGDVSEIHSKAIAKIFEVMKGSKSTKVVLCINKCGLFLNKLKEEFELHEKPADYLKQDYVNKLNGHYEREEQPVRLKEADILFTDWELDGNQESVDFGIIGVEEIKNIIRGYLIDYGIYESSEANELEKCVSSVSN